MNEDLNRYNLLALEEVLKSAERAHQIGKLDPKDLAYALDLISQAVKNGDKVNYSDTFVGMFVRAYSEEPEREYNFKSGL